MSKSWRLFLFLMVFVTLVSTTGCGTNQGPLIVGCNVDEFVDAIDQANADTDPTTIELAANCPYSFPEDNASSSYGATALPLITTPVTIHGNGSTLERQSTYLPLRFFAITGTGNLKLEDLTLQKGFSGTPQYAFDGGAIYNDGGVLWIYRSTFRENESSNDGGAIFNRGSLIIDENSAFENNVAHWNGGAIASTTEQDYEILVNDTIFEENEAAYGAAIHIGEGPSEFVINGSTLRSNYATDSGGAIYIKTQTASILESMIEGNSAWNDGGGLYIETGEVEIIGSTIQESEVDQGAGGRIFNELGQVTLRATRVHANHAGKYSSSGGGILNARDMYILDSTIDWNSSNVCGGILNWGYLSIENSTLSTSYDGVGLCNSHKVDLAFVTILYGSGPAIWATGGEIKMKNSLVYRDQSIYAYPEPPACAGLEFVQDMGGNRGCDTADEGTENLGPLQDNGGPTPTHAIHLPSTAASNVLDCTDLDMNPVTVDQRGESRISATGACDSGAYEYNGPPAPPPPEPQDVDVCSYTTNTTVNCRNSDYVEASLIAIIPENETLQLNAFNPTYSYGQFIMPDGERCWIWLELLEGPENPVDECDVPIVEAPPKPSIVEPRLTCKPNLDQASCEASGGTWMGLAAFPPCQCPE